MYEIAYITTTSKEEAVKIARLLVERKLVACVNTHSVSSIYRWGGKIEEGVEFVLICKTLNENREEIITLVKQKHSHQTPCVIFIPITGGNTDYLAWVSKNTRP